MLALLECMSVVTAGCASSTWPVNQKLEAACPTLSVILFWSYGLQYVIFSGWLL
jgi:hypothetical protein